MPFPTLLCVTSRAPFVEDGGGGRRLEVIQLLV